MPRRPPGFVLPPLSLGVALGGASGVGIATFHGLPFVPHDSLLSSAYSICTAERLRVAQSLKRRKKPAPRESRRGLETLARGE